MEESSTVSNHPCLMGKMWEIVNGNSPLGGEVGKNIQVNIQTLVKGKKQQVLA